MMRYLDAVSYHQRRRDQERRCAEGASHLQARRSHADLAKLHDLRRVLAYLGPDAPNMTELIGLNQPPAA